MEESKDQPQSMTPEQLLQSYLEEIQQLLSSQDLKRRFECFLNEMKRLKFVTQGNQQRNFNQLIDASQELTQVIRDEKSRIEIEERLKGLEAALVAAVLPIDYEKSKQKLRKLGTYSAIDKALPKLAHKSFKKEFPSELNFEKFKEVISRRFAEISLGKVEAIEGLFKKLLGSEQDSSFPAESTQKVFEKVYGRFNDYLRLKTISEYCYPELPGISFEFSVTVKSIYPDFRDNGFIWLDQKFEIDPSGLPGSKRYCSDGLVVFGRVDDEEDLVDIPLPPKDDINSYVHAIMYLRKEAVFIQDTSERGKVGIKLLPEDSLQLQTGMLVMFSTCMVVEVQKINSEEDNSEIYLRFLSEPHKDQVKKFESSEQQSFKVGCGGGGHAPDLFITKNGTGVSRLHAYINYLPESSTWELKDAGSSNGTFFLLKGLEQFMSGEPSDLFPIYSREPGAVLKGMPLDRPRVLSFGDYSFDLTPHLD